MPVERGDCGLNHGLPRVVEQREFSDKTWVVEERDKLTAGDGLHIRGGPTESFKVLSGRSQNESLVEAKALE